MKPGDLEKAQRAKEQYHQACREELAFQEETAPWFRDSPEAHERFGKSWCRMVATSKEERIRELRYALGVAA